MTVATFQYRAVDKAGAKRRGSLKASTQQDAYRRLTMQGLTPVRLRAAEGRAGRGRRIRVSTQEITHFTYQLAVLLEARIPIAEGLISIAEQESNGAFAGMLQEIAASIQAGSTITEAMKPFRRVFGDVYIETVHAAEHSGTMIKVLETLAEMLERQGESGKQLRGALTYPVVVVTAITLATTFLLVFVIPRFADMFAQRGVELPILTRVLQAFGLSIRNFWWAYGGGAVGAVIGLRLSWRSPQGRRLLDRMLNRTPVVRSALIGLAVSRFARVFGLCLSSGLGLLESLDMAGRASGRPLLQHDAELLMRQVRQGEQLTSALRQCTYLPSFVKRMISAGEQSSELTRLLDVVARHYEREVTHLTKNIATIIEPVLIAVMTGVVLVVALAVFLPMWDMVGLIG